MLAHPCRRLRQRLVIQRQAQLWVPGQRLGPNQCHRLPVNPARQPVTRFAQRGSQILAPHAQLFAQLYDNGGNLQIKGKLFIHGPVLTCPTPRLNGAGPAIRGALSGAMLNTITHGTVTDKPTLVIAHGLYGSARNWGVIAKRLSDERQVMAVDLRNHGDSPWNDNHSYPDMADDLAELIGQISGPVDILGHSMGGKSAMMLALRHPELVRRLVVADIAPVAYTHSQIEFIEAMRNVDLTKVERRSDAEAQLAEYGVDRALQSFFTQSLDVTNKRWRLNLDVLAANMPEIMSFPKVDTHWPGPALFLAGGSSDYVKPEHRPLIRTLFPKARFARLAGAGHWLHAEKPREFEATVRVFLSQ